MLMFDTLDEVRVGRVADEDLRSCSIDVSASNDTTSPSETLESKFLSAKQRVKNLTRDNGNGYTGSRSFGCNFGDGESHLIDLYSCFGAEVDRFVLILANANTVAKAR
jgi:hypothetical protein